MRRLLVLIGFMVGPTMAAAQGQLNVICSVQIEWCQILATVFSKSSGVKVNMVQKGSGEAIAQLSAEAANPRTDLWFGGTGDPHLQAAERGLTQEYRSPSLAELQDWAQGQARDRAIARSASTLACSASATAKRRWRRRSWRSLLAGPTC